MKIELIASIARKMNKTARVLLRIKPGVEAHTHEYIQTGQEDSKFGLGIKDGEAMKAVKAILACSELEYFGLHCHIGSQIFELDPFKLVTDIMVDLMRKIKAETGAETAELDLGGGFGIHYVSEDKPLEPKRIFNTWLTRLEPPVRQPTAAYRIS
jgi:diaminopimelate decarboxylase